MGIVAQPEAAFLLCLAVLGGLFVLFGIVHAVLVLSDLAGHYLGKAYVWLLADTARLQKAKRERAA